ncbi:MAG: response regulator [Verrucomicrobiota bacterium]
MATSVPARCILVVDDEPLVCDSVKRVLMRDGHKVEAVAGPVEALALLESRSFDLVFVDYIMPGMKGDALAAAIKSLRPQQPVVLMSATADTLEISPMAGVDSMIGKPFELDDLRRLIANIPSVRSGGQERV